MAERYFNKDKKKYSVGYSDVVFKYDPKNHDIISLETRFDECDKNGKTITKTKATKSSPKKGGK